MSESLGIEKTLTLKFKKMGVTSLEGETAESIIKTIKSYKRKNKMAQAANYCAALANIVKDDATIALRAARSYQKSNDDSSAARWYLITAERYANSYQATKSIAVLRIYTQLKPEDKEGPKRIYETCIAHGADENTRPSVLLSEENVASSKLMANRLFRTFDRTSFDRLFKKLHYHKLRDGEVLTKMGDKATSLFIIISGAVSGYLIFYNKRTYLGDIGEGSICGETAYFTGGRRTAEMIAKGETEVFELPYSMLDQFKTELPSFNQRIESLYKCRMLVKQLTMTTLLEDATAQCREWVATRMEAKVIKAGQVLIKQGEKTLDMYLVRRGKLAVTVSVGGESRLIKTIETGAIVGEAAIFANQKRTATVYAYTDCVLMKLNGEQYKAIYSASKPIQEVVEKLHKRHLIETFNLMKNDKIVEGDETCEILLKDIWSHH